MKKSVIFSLSRQWRRVGLLTLIFFHLSLTALAQIPRDDAHHEETTGDASIIVVTGPETSSAGTPTGDDEPSALTAIYDPEAAALLEPVAISQIIQGVQVPEGPSAFLKTDALHSLTRGELDAFHAKRRAYLGQFIKSMRFLRLSANYTQEAINKLNDLFYQYSSQILHSNTTGATIQLSVSAGLALPKLLTDRLRAKPWGKNLPKRGGFFIRLGMGVGLSRVQTTDGETSWIFDAFVDIHRLKSTITGIALVSAEIGAGPTFDRTSGNLHGTSLIAGGAGVILSTPEMFSPLIHPGPAFPAVLASLMVYENRFSRIYLWRLKLPTQQFSKFMRWVTPERKQNKMTLNNQCQSLFN